MKLLQTVIGGLFIAETNAFSDDRGNFSRLFCQRELEVAIGRRKIVQINRSITLTSGTIRGMHYQHPPNAEIKLVRCLKGRIWDVVVDLRAGSPTLLHWHAEELSLQNARMIIIPEGCAHGFQVLEENSELLYMHTDFYKPEVEDGVAYNDPQLGINWPLPVTDLSERDQQFSPTPADFSGNIV